MKRGYLALVASLLLATSAQAQSYAVGGSATPTGAPGSYRGYAIGPQGGETPTTAPVVTRHYDVYSATGSTPLGGTSASPQADSRACCAESASPAQQAVTAQGRATTAQNWGTPASNYHCLPSYNGMNLFSREGGSCVFKSETKTESCACGSRAYKDVHTVTMPSFSASDGQETVYENCTPCLPVYYGDWSSN